MAWPVRARIAGDDATGDYDRSSEHYQALYVLDADSSFAIARDSVEHLSDREHLKPPSVSEIAHDGPRAYRRNPTRGYTPTHFPTGSYGPEYQGVADRKRPP